MIACLIFWPVAVALIVHHIHRNRQKTAAQKYERELWEGFRRE